MNFIITLILLNSFNSNPLPDNNTSAPIKIKEAKLKNEYKNYPKAIIELPMPFGIGSFTFKTETDLFVQLRLGLRILFHYSGNHYLGVFLEGHVMTGETDDGYYIDFVSASLFGYRYLKKYGNGDLFFDIVPIFGLAQHQEVQQGDVIGPGLSLRFGAAYNLGYFRIGTEYTLDWIGPGVCNAISFLMGFSF